MKLLLDTHILLWFLADTKKLSKTAVNAIKRADTVFLVLLIYGKLELKHQFGQNMTSIVLKIFT